MNKNPAELFFFLIAMQLQKKREGSHVTSLTQGQPSGESNLYFHKPQLPARVGW